MTGVTPEHVASKPKSPIPGERDIAGGDVESDILRNTYVGEEAPGGSVAVPDQDRVDDLGKALGVQEVDSGALRTTRELMDERDRHRAQQELPEPKEEP
jgi:hypothetical protein